MMKKNLRGGSMIFVLTETWPFSSSVEVVKEAVNLAERPSVPEVMKLVGPYVVMGGDGVKTYTVYEVVATHQTEQALSDIMARLSGFFRIPGYRASLEVAMTQTQALQLVGSKAS